MKLEPIFNSSVTGLVRFRREVKQMCIRVAVVLNWQVFRITTSPFMSKHFDCCTHVRDGRYVPTFRAVILVTEYLRYFWALLLPINHRYFRDIDITVSLPLLGSWVCLIYDCFLCTCFGNLWALMHVWSKSHILESVQMHVAIDKARAGTKNFVCARYVRDQHRCHLSKKLITSTTHMLHPI